MVIVISLNIFVLVIKVSFSGTSTRASHTLFPGLVSVVYVFVVGLASHNEFYSVSIISRIPHSSENILYWDEKSYSLKLEG